MTSFTELLSQGSSHAWLFIPTAILLGALHGLEPGHSKTMMAAFIVAVRGTIPQAILLGLSAAFSHSLIIWLLAAVALHFGSRFNAESTEPYFQLASGIIIIALAVWMFWRTRREQVAASTHSHSLGGPHGGQLVDTGDGFIEISVFETNVPPRFRLYFYDTNHQPKEIDTSVTLITIRDGGISQAFSFVSEGDYLESTHELPEPHAFEAVIEL
ncbi:MAG: nickel/cobalt efflux protein RcnA, partial [Chthoniobacterales bacterium]